MLDLRRKFLEGCGDFKSKQIVLRNAQKLVHTNACNFFYSAAVENSFFFFRTSSIDIRLCSERRDANEKDQRITRVTERPYMRAGL